MTQHPCLNCGACCAYYRVSFHWSETLAESFGVPLGLTLPMPPHRQVMNGTDQEKPLCVAFKGKIGGSGSCTIYKNRPSCCREFKASFEDGNHSENCDKARAGNGLGALTVSDWEFK